MSHYLLDTNIASFVLKGNRPDITAVLATLPVTAIVAGSDGFICPIIIG